MVRCKWRFLAPEFGPAGRVDFHTVRSPSDRDIGIQIAPRICIPPWAGGLPACRDQCQCTNIVQATDQSFELHGLEMTVRTSKFQNCAQDLYPALGITASAQTLRRLNERPGFVSRPGLAAFSTLCPAIKYIQQFEQFVQRSCALLVIELLRAFRWTREVSLRSKGFGVPSQGGGSQPCPEQWSLRKHVQTLSPADSCATKLPRTPRQQDILKRSATFLFGASGVSIHILDQNTAPLREHCVALDKFVRTPSTVLTPRPNGTTSNNAREGIFQR